MTGRGDSFAAEKKNKPKSKVIIIILNKKLCAFQRNHLKNVFIKVLFWHRFKIFNRCGSFFFFF